MRINSYRKSISELKANGNYRLIPNFQEDITNNLIDFSSNDYLGLGANKRIKEEFFSKYEHHYFEMTASASRLLSQSQNIYLQLESLLNSLYNKEILLFNSGYHANTGILSALCNKNTLIVADKLVHASIIDGIILSRAPFVRFKHNNYDELELILDKESPNYENIFIITESIFSMDGDCCDLPRLVNIKKQYDNVILYVDEAHAFGVFGENGLGLAEELDLIPEIDILVGTFGKACASSGAFVATTDILKEYLINKSRSFIFSTAIPPICCLWTKFIIEHFLGMQKERLYLKEISLSLCNEMRNDGYNIDSVSQIIPLIIGDSAKTLEISKKLRNLGYIALPIRTPTVPKGTERIRLSLNSNLSKETITQLIEALRTIR